MTRLGQNSGEHLIADDTSRERRERGRREASRAAHSPPGQSDIFTARELAVKLDSCEKGARYTRRRLTVAEDALRSIARGEWTLEGARQAARDALDRMGRVQA